MSSKHSFQPAKRKTAQCGTSELCLGFETGHELRLRLRLPAHSKTEPSSARPRLNRRVWASHWLESGQLCNLNALLEIIILFVTSNHIYSELACTSPSRIRHSVLYRRSWQLWSPLATLEHLRIGTRKFVPFFFWSLSVEAYEERYTNIYCKGL